MYAILHAASPLSALSVSIAFRWVIHFSGEKSGLQNIKGKMKNNIKCNQKLIACIKALVNEDAQRTIQEIAEALAISLGSVSNNLKDKLRYNKVSARRTSHILT